MVLKADFSSSQQCELEGGDRRGSIKSSVPPGAISTRWAQNRRRSSSRKKSVGAVPTRALGLMRGSTERIAGSGFKLWCFGTAHQCLH